MVKFCQVCKNEIDEKIWDHHFGYCLGMALDDLEFYKREYDRLLTVLREVVDDAEGKLERYLG